MSNLEHIIEQYPEESFVVLHNYDEAILGVSSDMRLVYDSNIIIEILGRDMSPEDAVEFFEYNIESTYFGEKSPILMTTNIRI